MSGLRIMAGKCSSCIFGPNSPVAPERFAELRALWEQRGAEAYQICHQTFTGDTDDEDYVQPDMTSEAAVCGGFYEEMYQRRGIAVQVIQVAERMGWIEFVEPEPEEESDA